MLQNVGVAKSKSATLSAKQQAFVDQYLIDRNATRAYLEVYKGKVTSAGASGARLLKDARIAAEVARRVAVVSEKAGVTVAYVIENLTEVVERCMERAPVMVRNPVGPGMEQKRDDDGNHVWEFDSRGATGALKLLAQHLGMLKDAKADALLSVADALRSARERASRR